MSQWLLRNPRLTSRVGTPCLASETWVPLLRIQRFASQSLAHCVSLFLLSCALPAQTPSKLDILKTVDAHYNHLSSLRCRYTERYAGMGLDRQESGTLTLKKPGRMRWAYDSPSGKLFLLDGKSAWFYTPGDPQAQRIPARQLDDLRTPLRLLLGHTQLTKELDSIAVLANPAGFRITGIPKGMQNRIKLLTLQVTPAGEITGIRLEELDGAFTDFTFIHIEENVQTQASEFVFTPPPGVTIVEGSAPI